MRSIDPRPGGGALLPLRILLVASLVLPALLFAYGAAVSYRAQLAEAAERLRHATEIVHEHAVKVFETHELVLDRVNETIAGLSDAEIAGAERSLHARFAELVRNLPQIQDVFVVGSDGRILVSAKNFPVPAGIDVSDRDYFAAQAERPQTFVSRIMTGRLDGARFFNLSKRRPSADGGFAGLTLVSVQPGYFEGFYARLAGEAEDEGYAVVLGRPAGDQLVRYPRLAGAPADRVSRTFPQQIADAPDHGVYEAKAAADGVPRIIAYRKLAAYPAYVAVAVPRASVLRRWLLGMATHLVFGIPATLCLFGITLVAIRRTRREQAAVAAAAEAARRRHEAEEAMRQAQKMEALGNLTGGIAHDFNNLLMVIAGNAEIARAGLDGKAARPLDAILRAARRGESLTRQLLSFSRRRPLQPKVIDPHARLPKMVEILSRSLPPGIELAVDVADDVWLVEADPGELELALLNLAVNARDAMPEGGRLCVAARNHRAAAGEGPAGERTAGEFVAISVADTGQGMPPEVQARAFEPFFTTKEAGKGTGLGLSQVYGFATRSGGTATIDGAPGRGTTVTLYLPRSLKPLPGEAPQRPPGAGRGGARRALMVDDDAEVSEALAGLLGRLGYDVTPVERARQALDVLAAADGRIDLVLSDIMMPGGFGGTELAREIRQRHPGVPVLLVSGYSDAALAAGGEFDVLAKPCSLATLEEAIRRETERSRFRAARAAG